MQKITTFFKDLIYDTSHIILILAVVFTSIFLLTWRLDHLYTLALQAQKSSTASSSDKIQIEEEFNPDLAAKGLDIMVLLPEGTDVEGIAQILLDAHLIDDAASFITYLQDNSLKDKIQYGTHELNTLYDIPKISEILTTPPETTE